MIGISNSKAYAYIPYSYFFKQTRLKKKELSFVQYMTRVRKIHRIWPLCKKFLINWGAYLKSFKFSSIHFFSKAGHILLLFPCPIQQMLILHILRELCKSLCFINLYEKVLIVTNHKFKKVANIILFSSFLLSHAISDVINPLCRMYEFSLIGSTRILFLGEDLCY